jgi:hypothetical protein
VTARRPLLTALLALLILAPSARAQDPVASAAAAFRGGEPVYVDPPAAKVLGAADADRLRARIRDAGAEPMFVAAVPSSAGTPTTVLQALASETGRRGTYAVVVGKKFRAGSNDLGRNLTGDQAQAAFSEHHTEGVAAVLLAFADRMGRLRAGQRTGTGAGGSSGGSGGGGGGGGSFAAVGLIALLGLGGGALLLSRRRRRAAEREEVAELKENVRDDLVSLGDDIRAMDLDVEMPDADPAAKADYGRAVEGYQRADALWQRAQEPEDFRPVAEALEDARYAMASAKARAEGRQPPERTAPCFFDPRHGPSAREVEWAPRGGAPRPVPACEADAQRVERGEEPQSREVLVGGRSVPYWGAGPAYMPFIGGFGTGILAATIFDGWGMGMGGFGGYGWGPEFGYGGGWGGDYDGDGGGGGDFGGGGGDFGGGDFGGGGGDFGGGGGDFGGGGGDF